MDMHEHKQEKKTSRKLGCSAAQNIRLIAISRDSRPSVANSMRSRRQIKIQTVHQVIIDLVEHTKPRHPTSMVQMFTNLATINPGHRTDLVLKNLKVTVSSRTLDRRTVL